MHRLRPQKRYKIEVSLNLLKFKTKDKLCILIHVNILEAAI